MDDNDKLRPATEADIIMALSFALRHDGRKAFRHADDLMAQITASHLLAHLERSGFVLMQRQHPGFAHEFWSFSPKR